ncbi:MAG: hypothetical protein ABS35_05015 [Kaistia sp. SCN 65-12]|nr:MAG: hypothetical protein ABS35_05015 [Kaistia sp. SCN 65-12]
MPPCAKELMLAGVAAVALTNAAMAQDAASEQASAETQPEQARPAGNVTLLDKILILSRTGETAIESLSSSSHVDQEQIERRMARVLSAMHADVRAGWTVASLVRIAGQSRSAFAARPREK